MTTPEKAILNWDEIIKDLPPYKQALQEPDCILALSRGGLIPATILAYQFHTNNIIVLNTELYDPKNNEKHNEVKIEKLSPADIKKINKAKQLLIIDDILDTGDSLKAATIYIKSILKKVTNIQYFVVIKKLTAKEKVPEIYDNTISIYETKTDKWIVFPWDEDVPPKPTLWKVTLQNVPNHLKDILKPFYTKHKPTNGGMLNG